MRPLVIDLGHAGASRKDLVWPASFWAASL